ncbi:unnamed protein product [Phytomonas sp. EM1]|nr:unnamed protein product [Phytomonas sp. EM1]|eukprot:CCW62087.1 unnamed protein product [Phytomonas sp. isolate EM1]
MTYKIAFSVLGSSLGLALLSLISVRRQYSVTKTDATPPLSTSFIETPEAQTLRSCKASGRFSNAVAHAANFLNEYSAAYGGNAWTVDYDDFSNFQSKIRKNKACFQLLHLREKYTPLEKDQTPVPFLRLLVFLPFTTTSEVYTHMTDLKLRREWDSNYLMFERFTTDQGSPKDNLTSVGTECSAASSTVSGVATRVDKGLPSVIGDKMARPIRLVAEKMQRSQDSVRRRLPDIESRVVDRGWFCHSVGSSFLTKLGLLPRLFLYERVSYEHSLTGEGNVHNDASRWGREGSAKQPSLLIYDVLYSGTRREMELAMRSSSALEEWIRVIKKKVLNYVDVEMNYLHLLLLPIMDFEQQVQRDRQFLVKYLSESGSINDQNATKLVYEIFKESARISADAQQAGSLLEKEKPRRQSGVLLLMTAANDAGVAQSLPQFVQTTLATAVSKQAYHNLIKSCHASSL